MKSGAATVVRDAAQMGKPVVHSSGSNDIMASSGRPWIKRDYSYSSVRRVSLIRRVNWVTRETVNMFLK